MRRRLTGLLCGFPIAILLVGGAAEARDEFDAVRCGKQVSTALVGRQSGNESVAQIEARHRDLKLKNLGGEQVSDTVNSASWLICGTEYQLLYDSRQIVRDALSFPAHGRASPEFWGICQRRGQTLPGTVIAILDNPSAHTPDPSHFSVNDGTLLPAKTAWGVDGQSKRFFLLSPNGLRCPRSGIITADGGP